MCLAFQEVCAWMCPIVADFPGLGASTRIYPLRYRLQQLRLHSSAVPPLVDVPSASELHTQSFMHDHIRLRVILLDAIASWNTNMASIQASGIGRDPGVPLNTSSRLLQSFTESTGHDDCFHGGGY